MFRDALRLGSRCRACKPRWPPGGWPWVTPGIVGRAARVAVSTVGRWECGTQTPQPWQRADLAKSLGVTLTELDTLLEHTTGRDRNPAPANTGPADRQASATTVRDSQQAWLRVRQAPVVRGRELTELAAWLCPKRSAHPAATSWPVPAGCSTNPSSWTPYT